MSEAQPEAEPDLKPASILRRMFETGEWSDLKIQTETRTFDVHKNVMCPASPFFQAACSRDWKEAKTGVICVPEDEHTIKGFIRYCYGIFDPDQCSDDSITQYDRAICELLIAADKLAEEVAIEYLSWSWEYYADTTDLGIWLYGEERRYIVGPKIIREIVSSLASAMQRLLLSDDGSWSKLQSCPELMTDVVRFVARKSSRVSDAWLLDSPAYMQAADGAGPSDAEA
ncbi:Putative BTB/POZ domain-containing protein [Septoria linicola]|uniref:BTB/POZ domain-containing protein n=1 Tax=Septoria linicola TaxID=215465 RepID=A0A9Q9EMB1_9PEZI|nr:putative BTB/POZ domain-containing protein [Septoria linicola]USW56641.1 Putative BTB/POZ domain-containing protein [Septoria linicola]